MLESRRLVVLALFAASLVGGFVTGRDILFSLAYLWSSLLMISFLWTWAGVSWLKLSRQTRVRRAQVGRPLEERLAVHNTGRLPKLWIEIRDFSDLPDHRVSRVVEGLGPHAERAWNVRTICRERGRYRLGPLTVSAGDPFGLFQMERHLPQTSNVVIYPYTVRLPEFELPVGLLPGGDALRRRTHYVTPNASSVRDYAPGDSFNRIHWPSTARRNRLIVKEFELDPQADVWIFLDACRHVYAPEGSVPIEEEDGAFWRRAPEFKLPPSVEEYAVSAAASLAQYFIRLDRAVGLAFYGQFREVVQADRGERQLTRILESLAVVRARGQLYLDEVLAIEAVQLARGTTAILVTPSAENSVAVAARSLQRRGLRVAAALIDAASFGGPPGTEGLAMLLRGANIATRIVHKDDDLAAALAGGGSRNGVGLIGVG